MQVFREHGLDYSQLRIHKQGPRPAVAAPADCYYDSHDPAVEAIMLHGHVHAKVGAVNRENARAGILRYDVGVDANGHKPTSIDHILAFMARYDPRLV